LPRYFLAKDTNVSKDKLKTLKKLKNIRANLKSRGLRVVFTNGCFDILHLGHIKYLQKARSSGDRLIVGLNSDASVRKIKGKGRPIFSQKARAVVLASCEYVDYVVGFSENTPLRLIKAIKPDVLVKGADWQKDKIVGKHFVASYGGKVVRANFIKGYSTSSIIAKIKKVK